MPEQPIVHVIKPTVQTTGGGIPAPLKKRRVAAYARVSTDDEEQLTSYENQVDFYPRYIKSKPEWEFAGLYTDRGISGLSTKQRPGFNQMVEDALAGKIDLILTKSISRFARNTVDSLTVIRQLKDKGVEIYFEKENIYTFDSRGELLITIMSSIAQEESRSISENVTWGKRRNMARGKVSMPYAQFLGYERGPDGKPQINEEQAAIVRRIYQMFLDGNSVREITRVLTREGIPTPSGRCAEWRVPTVLSILRNEKYKGDALLQKVYTVDFLNKKHAKNNGVLPQYYVENSHPGIIDEETFDMVQAELASREKNSRGRRAESVFDRKVICADCGHLYGRKLWYSHNGDRDYVWRCTHKYDTTGGCKTPVVHEEDLRFAFLAALNQILGVREEYIAEMEQEIEALLRVKIDPEDRESRTAINAQIGQIRRYLHALRKKSGMVSEFDDHTFNTLAESMIVQANGDMTVLFRNGREITVPKS